MTPSQPPNKQAETPRFDNFLRSLRSIPSNKDGQSHQERICNFARTLEQELNEAKKIMDIRLGHEQKDFEKIRALESQLTQVQKERDEAQMLLGEAQQWLDSEPDWKDKFMKNYSLLQSQTTQLSTSLKEVVEDLKSIEEYWNGAEGSAVDAVEEMRHRAKESLTKLQAILKGSL